MSIIMCELSKYFCSYNETEAFCKWAFGTTRLILKECCHAWNERHGKILNLSPSDSIGNSISKMKEIWKEDKREAREWRKKFAQIKRETGWGMKDNSPKGCSDEFCRRCK